MANLTQIEAERLLRLLKETILKDFEFPNPGKIEYCQVNSVRTKDQFTISVFRAKKNHKKYNYVARIKNDDVILMLHINPSFVHPNPSGEIIEGNHWHIYSEKHGMSIGYPAEDIENEKFVENTILFFEKFNIIKQPNVIFNTSLIDES